MGWNFDDNPGWTPRNIFRKHVEPEPVSAASPVPPAEEWRRLGQVLFKVLKNFPDAYHAVINALREFKIELQAAPTPSRY